MGGPAEPMFTIVISEDEWGIDEIVNDKYMAEGHRAEIARMANAGEIVAYDMAYYRDCPEHGWGCKHAERLGGTDATGPFGYLGAYRSPGEIADKDLREKAQDVVDGRYPG